MITTFTYPKLKQNKQFCFTPALFVTVLPGEASFVLLNFANFGSTNARNNEPPSPACSPKLRKPAILQISGPSAIKKTTLLRIRLPPRETQAVLSGKP